MKDRPILRLLCMVLVWGTLLGLTACGTPAPTQSSGITSSGAAQESGAPAGDVGQSEAETESDASTGGKILIAYFAEAENSEVDVVASPSVVVMGDETVGRMRALAEMIQQETGGDLFSIQTSVDYPADIGALIDYASVEQRDGVRPELTGQIEDLDAYDTIFIGYPNWWYDMPMVLYSFFDAYDFSGKTIIPFNSHNGSRFSSTISTIEKLEPEANVVEEGLTVHERDVAGCADEVAEWLRGLGY